MSLNLTVVIDNDEAIKKFRELQKVAKTTTSDIVSDSERMDMAIRKFGSALASIGIGFSFTELARQVATVRGEFQQLEVAFSTMLGNKAEADALMQRTVELAATTPFDLQGVAEGTKQLLAYGSTATEVTDEIRMLGDIAAGLSLPLGDLVYLYGTTRTQGRLFTQDLRQFMGRGIPLAEELAKQFGVTKDKVGELVTEGKVGFDDMQKALVSMTSQGGKFYNLMEAQSKTITGQMSNLQDSIQQMFNDIGKQSEGVISQAIGVASDLVENYEKIGKVLIDVVAAYGSYKAAIMIVNAASKLRAAYLATETSATIAATVANQGFAKALSMVANAIKASSLASLANPYTLAAAALAALTYGVYKWITAKSDEEKAIERVNNKTEEYKTKLSEAKSTAEEYYRVMSDSNASIYKKKEEYDKLIQKYPQLLELYDEEKIKLMKEAELTTALIKLERDLHREKLKTRLSELEDGYSKAVSWDKPEIFEEMNKIRGELSRLEAEEIQINFEFLSVDDKIKKYEEDLTSLNAKIAEYNSLIQQSDRADQYASIVKELEAEKAQVIKNINTLKDQKSAQKTSQTNEDIEKIAKERQKAEADAHKSEMDLAKSQLTDKADILEFEMNQELAAIDERISKTTDKIVKGYLEREKAAKEALYRSKIEEATIDKKVFEGIIPQLSFDIKLGNGNLGALKVGDSIKEDVQRNIPEITTLFGDMRNKTAKDLNAIADEAEKMMGSISDPEELDAIRNAINQLRDDAESLESPLQKLADGFKDLFNSEVGSEKFYDAIGYIKTGLNSVIDVAEGLDSVLDSIGHGEALDGVVGGLSAAIGALESAEKGAKIGSVFGPIGAAAGAAVGAVGSLVKSISQIHDKNNERRIQGLQDQIESLEASYNDLGRAINSTHSTNASKIIEEQNRLLEQQIKLVEQQKAEEEDKKDTDNNRVKEYEQQINDIENAIEDNVAKAKEAVTGISFGGFYDSFVSTLADMSKSSEDFANSFEDYLKNAILGALIAKQYEGRIQKLYDNFAEAGKDSEITQKEREALKAEHDAIVDDMLKDRKELAEIYGWNDESSSSQSASSSNGFQTMSQETASELNGRFTDIQGKVTEIRSFVMELMTTGKLQYDETVNMRDIMIQINGNVADISQYTKVLPSMKESIDSMNRKLDNL